MSSSGKYPQHTMLEEGQGLWKQIKDSNRRHYDILTGSRGMQLFQDSFKRVSLTALLEDMTDDFTPEEMTRMKEMIDSEDVENMEVVQAILESKFGVE